MPSIMASNEYAASCCVAESQKATSHCRPAKAHSSRRQSDETNHQAQQRLPHMPWAKVCSEAPPTPQLNFPADRALESSAMRKSQPVCAAGGATYNAKATTSRSSLTKVQDCNAEHREQQKALPKNLLLRRRAMLFCQVW